MKTKLRKKFIDAHSQPQGSNISVCTIPILPSKSHRHFFPLVLSNVVLLWPVHFGRCLPSLCLMALNESQKMPDDIIDTFEFQLNVLRYSF